MSTRMSIEEVSVGMTAEGRGTWLLGIAVTAAVANVGLNLVLIPRWGPSGAAAATVAAAAAALSPPLAPLAGFFAGEGAQLGDFGSAAPRRAAPDD